MMSLSVLTARATVVCSIGSNCGAPWYTTSGALMSFLLTVAVCGTDASSTASAAFVRARNRRQHAGARMLFRNLLEVGRQGGRREGPRSGEVGRREPSAGHQVVDEAVFAGAEHVALGVVDPQQAGAVDGQIARLAFQQNHLRRLQADEYVRGLTRRDLLARQRRLHVFPILVGGQLRETVGQLAGGRPRSLERRMPSSSCCQPEESTSS